MQEKAVKANKEEKKPLLPPTKGTRAMPPRDAKGAKMAKKS